jgi:hypothetical protein
VQSIAFPLSPVGPLLGSLDIMGIFVTFDGSIKSSESFGIDNQVSPPLKLGKVLHQVSTDLLLEIRLILEVFHPFHKKRDVQLFDQEVGVSPRDQIYCYLQPRISCQSHLGQKEISLCP